MEKTLNVLNELEKKEAWEGIEKMSLSKMKRRQQLAKLSFEKKYLSSCDYRVWLVG
jgi:hypothetical protein